MCSVLEHRGPDDEGLYVSGNVGLGHRRLSIIDLSAAGHQPMANEDGSIRIVFNGEIYNFPQLRDELEKKGHVFSSHTDTEAILHLYEEKGVECLQDLRGMFAFALWDENRRRLLLARDRLGKKPLVYALNNRRLLFASEIKSILLDPGIQKEVDPTALQHYLTYQFVPSPLTIFKGIQKLPPAHYMVYENGNTTIQRYWDLSYEKKLPCRSLDEYKEHFLNVFTEAVRIRLKSDVPFGAFLSGGIDSSIVVAVMSSMLDQPVKTFSIGFEEEEYDELAFARMIAERYRTNHQEFIVKPDVVDILPKLVWHYNEPYGDSSAVPTYCLAKMTRQHVTVALNGDGSDECFAGYPRYVEAKKVSRLRKIAGWTGRSLVEKSVQMLPAGPNRHSFTNRLKRYVKAFYESPQRRYVRWLCIFDNDMKHEICTRAFQETVRDIDSIDLTEELYNRADGKAFIDKILYVDVMSYLPEDLLVKVDIASMAHSLEARSPFVDHKVMECAASLPADLKLRGFETKYFLKRILSEFLPPEILYRKKMGFGVPIDRWLRKDLKEMAYDLLLDKTATARGYFRKDAVKLLLDEHVTGQYDHCYRIWNLLWLELWHRMYMDNPQTVTSELLK
jgi:asparagine synthase (glutamine-hydrolysing)